MSQFFHSLVDSFKVYTQRQVISLFFLGFSAGLPLMLVFSALSFWLREAGVDRASIGFFSWVTLAYASKWLWAPAIDKISLPFISNKLGRRRSWLLSCQLLLIVAITAMAFINPQTHLYYMAVAAVTVAFLSATQDIVIDAFRIESGEEKQQAAMVASYMVGYRLAMIAATAGAFLIADSVQTVEGYDYLSWKIAYSVMAALMLVGVFATLMSPEPKHLLSNQVASTPKGLFQTLKNAIVDPVLDLIQRYKWHAVILVILICTYRISDIVMGVMANVFYVDMGYSKSEIATISKVYGVIMTLTGALLAGGLINRFGVLPMMLVGALLSAATNILYILLSQSEHNVMLLTSVISIDNLSAGLAGAAIIAFMSSLTNREFTATQYAWMSSAMILLPKFLGGFSGVWLESLGYTYFFTMTALIGIPTILAILYLINKKWQP